MDDTLETEQSAFSPMKNVQSGIRFDGISNIFFFFSESRYVHTVSVSESVSVSASVSVSVAPFTLNQNSCQFST